MQTSQHPHGSLIVPFLQDAGTGGHVNLPRRHGQAKEDAFDTFFLALIIINILNASVFRSTWLTHLSSSYS